MCQLDSSSQSVAYRIRIRYFYTVQIGAKQFVLRKNDIASRSIELFDECLLQVPANRIGYTALSLAQLKIMQEVITLSVFVPFSPFFMGEKFRLDFVWAALCLCGAVFFIFRK